MEAKTIGSFIAALRRANGMTQKDFAERLNVSDKTVSRWERDEGAPDLTLIPVIAELFGVTCDELLRGERKPSAPSALTETDTTADVPQYSAKAEKQRSHILRTTIARHRNRSLISAAVAGIGFLGAVILNTALTRAYLGFFIAAILYLAAVICETIIVNGTLASVTEDLADEKELAEFRYRVFTDSRTVFVLTAILLGACVPLLMVGDAYWGLTAEMWLTWGMGFAVITALVCGVIVYFIENRLIADGVIAYPPKIAAIIIHRRRLKKRLVLLCIGVLSVTALLNGILTAFGSTNSLADSIRFDDVDEFIAFAEQEMQDIHTGYTSSFYYDSGIVVVPEEQPYADKQYFDAYGNPISEEEALTRTVEDRDGNVVISYIQRNETMASITFGTENNGFLPIYVKTTEHIRAAQRLVNQINSVFTVVYVLEILSCLFAYFLLRTPKRTSHSV